MNKEEYMIDRMYDAMYERYQEEERIPISEYRKLEDEYDELNYKMQDLLYYIKENDIAGAYEYAKSEGLVWTLLKRQAPTKS